VLTKSMMFSLIY